MSFVFKPSNLEFPTLERITGNRKIRGGAQYKQLLCEWKDREFPYQASWLTKEDLKHIPHQSQLEEYTRHINNQWKEYYIIPPKEGEQRKDWYHYKKYLKMQSKAERKKQKKIVYQNIEKNGFSVSEESDKFEIKVKTKKDFVFNNEFKRIKSVLMKGSDRYYEIEFDGLEEFKCVIVPEDLVKSLWADELCDFMISKVRPPNSKQEHGMQVDRSKSQKMALISSSRVVKHQSLVSEQPQSIQRDSSQLKSFLLQSQPEKSSFKESSFKESSFKESSFKESSFKESSYKEKSN